MNLWGDGDRLPLPAALRAACAELPDFERTWRLVRLARWWNVWIGGGAAVVAAVGVVLAMYAIAERPGVWRGWLFAAVAALLVFAGGLSWRVGLRLPRLVADRPRALRGSLALAAVAQALLVTPMATFLGLLLAADAGVIPGGAPAFEWAQLGVIFGGFASPAVGVFANGYPWLRLGRVYDAAADAVDRGGVEGRPSV
jgi:hypothetical protein